MLTAYTVLRDHVIKLIMAGATRPHLRPPKTVHPHDERMREVAGELDFKTFYGRFRIDPKTGKQIGHQILLVQWREGRKVILDPGVDPLNLSLTIADH